jgi:parvulin-like peptidyl-prolyl isomerase
MPVRRTNAPDERAPMVAPPLLVNQQAVTWDQLSPVMAEATGAAAIEEIALQFALRREFDTRRLRLSEEAIRAEQNLLNESLTTSGSSTDESSFTIMDELRAARGLGPVRFRTLLERNAMLRALVQDDILIDEPTLRTAYAIRHGLRRVVRLVVVPTQREASQIRNRLVSIPAEQKRAEFIQAAIEYSTDSTAPRGGLTEPISPDDPAYAQAVRRVLANLVPGEVSQVVSVDGGYALLPTRE